MALFTGIGTALGLSSAAWSGIAGGLSTATVAGAGVAAAGVGAAAYGMNAAAKANKTPQLPMPQVTPLSNLKTEAETIANKMAKARQKAASRTSTINTNPLGLADEASVTRKTLLGS